MSRVVQLRNPRRLGVGRDRFLPVADAREDMRRHVLRVRRAGRDLGITPGRIEPLLRNRRSVVQVDQIMRHARMVRLALRDRLQDRRAFELLGVSLVGRRRRRVQRERVVDLRLVVFRVALRQLLHRLRIGHDAGAVVDLVMVGIHHGERVDVVALTLRLGADAFALRDGRGALGEILRRRRHVRVQEQAQRDAPMGDAAFGVGFECLLEGLLRCAIPERMLVQHRAVEVLLRFRLA